MDISSADAMAVTLQRRAREFHINPHITTP